MENNISHGTKKQKKHKILITAPEVAKYCGTDLKTVHRWAKEKKIKFYQTDGGHLRFKADDIVEFMRQTGLDIPKELRLITKKLIFVITRDKENAHLIEEELTKKFEVKIYTDLLEAMIMIGKYLPEAIVLDTMLTFSQYIPDTTLLPQYNSRSIDIKTIVKVLRSCVLTKEIPIIVYGDKEEKEQLEGLKVDGFISKPNIQELKEKLIEILGDPSDLVVYYLLNK